MGNDLQNDVHLIFSPKKFPEDVYAMLEPSLRLATLMLGSGVLDQYITTLVDGDIETENGKKLSLPEDTLNYWDEDNNLCPGVSVRGNRNSNSVDQRQRVEEILTTIADMVVFGFTTDDSVRGSCAAVLRPLTVQASRVFKHGCMSRISMNASLYKELERLTVNSWMHDAKHFECTKLLLERFVTCEVLLHELGHSLHRASYGHCVELYYEGECLNEAGFAFTAQLFGGRISLEYPNSSIRALCACPKIEKRREEPFVVLEPWPSNDDLFKWYTSRGYCVARRKGYRSFDEWKRIPLAYVEKLFDPLQWENHKDNIRSLLTPPTVGSWVIQSTDRADDRWPADFKGIEERFGLRRAHRICPCLQKSSQRCLQDPSQQQPEDFFNPHLFEIGKDPRRKRKSHAIRKREKRDRAKRLRDIPNLYNIDWDSPSVQKWVGRDTLDWDTPDWKLSLESTSASQGGQLEDGCY
jgi:hypothetical protein